MKVATNYDRLVHSYENVMSLSNVVVWDRLVAVGSAVVWIFSGDGLTKQIYFDVDGFTCLLRTK